MIRLVVILGLPALHIRAGIKMKWPRFELSIFILTFCVLSFAGFLSAYIAFGLTEIESIGLVAKQVAYQTFLVLRYPSHQIAPPESALSGLHLELLVSSFIYSSLITLVISNIRLHK